MPDYIPRELLLGNRSVNVETVYTQLIRLRWVVRAAEKEGIFPDIFEANITSKERHDRTCELAVLLGEHAARYALVPVQKREGPLLSTIVTHSSYQWMSFPCFAVELQRKNIKPGELNLAADMLAVSQLGFIFGLWSSQLWDKRVEAVAHETILGTFGPDNRSGDV